MSTHDNLPPTYSAGEKIMFGVLMVAFLALQVFYLWIGGLYLKAEGIHHHRIMTEGSDYDEEYEEDQP